MQKKVYFMALDGFKSWTDSFETSSLHDFFPGIILVNACETQVYDQLNQLSKVANH
jgi:hypothetical protein